MKYSYDLPDKDELFSLFLTTGWNDDYRLTPEELTAAVTASTLTVSARYDHQLVGFGRMLSDGVLHGMIYEMIVLPQFQGRGIGSEILRRILTRAEDIGIREIQLFCAKGKEPFYIRHGFERRSENAPGMTLRK